MFFLTRENHTVVHVAFALRYGAQFALQQSLAQWRDIIDKNMALQVFILVLDDTGANAFKDLLVLLEVLIKVLNANFIGAHHLFINIGQT